METKKKILPSEVLRKEIDQIMEGLLEGEQQEQTPLSLLMQKAKRPILICYVGCGRQKIPISQQVEKQPKRKSLLGIKGFPHSF